MKLVVRTTRRDGSTFKAWCPALPGCAVIAASRQRAQSRIQRAVKGYLASLDVALPRELGRMLETEAACGIAWPRLHAPAARPAERESRPAAMETSSMYEKGRKKGMVRFALRVDGAPRAVAVAGDFSDWQPVGMKKQKHGTFVRHVPVGLDSFEYKFLVDGRWIKDPDHSTWAANCLGSFNSVGQLG